MLGQPVCKVCVKTQMLSSSGLSIPVNITLQILWSHKYSDQQPVFLQSWWYCVARLKLKSQCNETCQSRRVFCHDTYLSHHVAWHMLLTWFPCRSEATSVCQRWLYQYTHRCSFESWHWQGCYSAEKSRFPKLTAIIFSTQFRQFQCLTALM